MKKQVKKSKKRKVKWNFKKCIKNIIKLLIIIITMYAAIGRISELKNIDDYFTTWKYQTTISK